MLVLRVIMAAAWADGEMDARERALLESLISKSRLSQSRKAALTLDMEHAPASADVDAILNELCLRAKSDEFKQAIFALVDKMIGADSRMDVSEVDFREKLEKTLANKGTRFFSLIRERLS